MVRGLNLVGSALSSASQEEHAVETLRVSEARYRGLFETAQDGILILDAKTGQVVDANPFLKELLGYSQEEFLERKLWEIGPSKDEDSLKNAFAASQMNGRLRYGDLPLETKDGRRVEAEFASSAYEVDGTRFIQCNIHQLAARMQSTTTNAEIAATDLELAFQVEEKAKRVVELAVLIRERTAAKLELAFHQEEKAKRADELAAIVEERTVANKELAFQVEEKAKRADELAAIVEERTVANKELAFQVQEKAKRADELAAIVEERTVANKELAFQVQEKAKRADELAAIVEERTVANKELAFQVEEKAKRADELAAIVEERTVANKELAFQVQEKAKRADELAAIVEERTVANKELAFQVEEKAKRADELAAIVEERTVANKELAFQVEEKAKRADELAAIVEERTVANKELAFQVEEKAKRADELAAIVEERTVANKELAFQVQEKAKRADELAAINAKVTCSNEALEQSNEELAQFAYVASHDLQTPLRNISGFVQLLQENYADKLDAQAGDWIRRTVQSAEQLHKLIRDVLEYSRVDTRACRFEAVSLSDVFNDSVGLLEASIRAAEGQVTCDELPTVMGDRSQLAQLMQNLIGNGLKYHGESPPRVHVTAEHDGKEWIISVRDNGIGIAPRHQERIFEIFKRLHNQQEYPGTGIGLAICRRVVHRHGGKIRVESEETRGSVFKFTIPESIPESP